jgi:hypothetical protein
MQKSFCVGEFCVGELIIIFKISYPNPPNIKINQWDAYHQLRDTVLEQVK